MRDGFAYRYIIYGSYGWQVIPSSIPPAQTLTALPILPTLLMAIRSLILILTTLSFPATCEAPRLKALLSTPSTGLVLLLTQSRLTSCSSIPVLYTRRTTSTATTEGPSAAWPQIRFSNYPLQILPQKLTSWRIRSLGKFLWRSLCHYLSTL